MSVSNRIRQTVSEHLQPSHIALHNESHMHAGPATDSHFKLVLVADAFRGLTRVKRHQLVYRVLADEMLAADKGGSVHALALHLYAPEEWQEDGVPASPRCAGANGSS